MKTNILKISWSRRTEAASDLEILTGISMNTSQSPRFIALENCDGTYTLIDQILNRSQRLGPLSLNTYFELGENYASIH